MQEQNTASIDYFKNKERFADLINGYVYHGQQLISAEDILELDSVVSRIEGEGETLYADVYIVDLLRKVRVRCHAVLVALQNQTEIHYAMPIRVMNTDAAGYHNQWRELQKVRRREKALSGSAEFLSGMKKEDRLVPIFTMVTYFGRRPWDGPKTLKDLLNISELDEAIRKMIADYPMNLLEVRFFENLEWFHSDIRQVFGFLKYSYDKIQIKNFIEENRETFQDIEGDAYDLIGVMSDKNEFRRLKPKALKEGGKYDMSKAKEDMIQDGRDEGRKAGMTNMNVLIQKLMRDNRQEELLRSTTDPVLQKKLFKEYSLEM